MAFAVRNETEAIDQMIETGRAVQGMVNQQNAGSPAAALAVADVNRFMDEAIENLSSARAAVARVEKTRRTRVSFVG
jgi:hypothetical protein